MRQFRPDFMHDGLSVQMTSFVHQGIGRHPQRVATLCSVLQRVNDEFQTRFTHDSLAQNNLRFVMSEVRECSRNEAALVICQKNGHLRRLLTLAGYMGQHLTRHEPNSSLLASLKAAMAGAKACVA